MTPGKLQSIIMAEYRYIIEQAGYTEDQQAELEVYFKDKITMLTMLSRYSGMEYAVKRVEPAANDLFLSISHNLRCPEIKKPSKIRPGE